jgi:3-hydroxyacyl-CoA dehydrogenase
MGREEQVAGGEKVRSERRDDVLVAIIDNPPTAALTASVRRGLDAALDMLSSDPGLKALVIAGGSTGFATGADIQEDASPDTPELDEICDQIENSAKPVFAAIAGVALGGGLELAMAAHVRIARPDARLGSPEITLGLVPNAGGTQRLPKLVGGVAALKLLLSGRAVTGEQAQKLGLVDGLVPAGKDLVDATVEAARLHAATGRPLLRSSVRRDRLGEGTAFLEAVAAHRKAADVSPLDAPSRMIELIEAALLLPYDIGRGMEQAVFDDLVASEHTKSLRHVFAAERQLQAATRWQGRVQSRPMTGVAVVGAQGLGAEVVVQCLDAGFVVTVAEENDAALEDGVARIIGHFDARVAAGSMSEEAVEAVLDRMHTLSGFDKVSEADVVLDPAPVLTRKRVSALDAVMKAGAILVIGGEKVDVGTVAATTGRASDVVGMRFYPGVRRNRLVEMSVTDVTGPRAVATARALAQKLGRLIVDVAPGKLSVGTRILEALHAAADLCLEDGARVAQIDAALRDWGLPFGSFAWRDMTGIERHSAPRGMEGRRGGGIDAVLVSTGRPGISVGRGYYVYSQPGKPGVPDPMVEQMVEADRAAKQITARRLTDGEVRARCVAAMAAAGAQMLQEGIVRRAADIDMVAIHGLGFARRTGGVMFAADLMGLGTVRRIVAGMAAVTPRIPPPPDLLVERAASGVALSAEPETLETPAAPEAPAEPDTPDTPDTPETPAGPETPEALAEQDADDDNHKADD